MNHENGKTKIDIAKLQIQVETLDKNMNTILSNHLPHIYERMGSIEKKIAYYSGGIAIIIILAQAILTTWGK